MDASFFNVYIPILLLQISHSGKRTKKNIASNPPRSIHSGPYTKSPISRMHRTAPDQHGCHTLQTPNNSATLTSVPCRCSDSPAIHWTSAVRRRRRPGSHCRRHDAVNQNPRNSRRVGRASYVGVRSSCCGVCSSVHYSTAARQRTKVYTSKHKPRAHNFTRQENIIAAKCRREIAMKWRTGKEKK